MILKVRDNNAWVFIGEFTAIRTERVFLEKTERGGEEGVIHALSLYTRPALPEVEDAPKPRHEVYADDGWFLPRDKQEEVVDGKKPFVKVQIAYLRMKTNTTQTIVFHEAYLLNDEGKTIERL